MKTLNLVAAIEYNGLYQPGDFIGVDKGASYLYENKIKMIAAVGDFDSIDPTLFSELKKTKLNIISLPTQKDETDLEYALEYVKQFDYEQINVYGAIGKRIDHTLVNINLLKKHRYITIYDDYSKVFVLHKGSHQFKQDIYKFYSFFAIEDTSLTLIDFKYPLDKYPLRLDDTLCISNEFENEAKIIVDKDIIVVASL